MPHKGKRIVLKIRSLVVSGGAVAALVLTACGGRVATSRDSATPHPTRLASGAAIGQLSTVAGIPLAGDGEYEPGSYHVASGDATTVPFTFTVPGGWIGENGGQTISKHPNEDGEVG